jgi:hypothetical protein
VGSVLFSSLSWGSSIAEYPTWIPQQVVSRNTAPATRDWQNTRYFTNLYRLTRLCSRNYDWYIRVAGPRSGISRMIARYVTTVLTRSIVMLVSEMKYRGLEQSPSWEANSHLASEVPGSCRSRSFITMIATARRRPLCWITWVQFLPSHPVSLRYILILFSYLCLGLPSGPFPSVLL